MANYPLARKVYVTGKVDIYQDVIKTRPSLNGRQEPYHDQILIQSYDVEGTFEDVVRSMKILDERFSEANKMPMGTFKSAYKRELRKGYYMDLYLSEVSEEEFTRAWKKDEENGNPRKSEFSITWRPEISFPDLVRNK